MSTTLKNLGMLALTLIAIPVIGGLVALLSKMGFYLVFVMPAGMGLAAGMIAILWRDRLGWSRNAATPVAIIGAIGIYACYFFAEYLLLVNDMRVAPSFIAYLQSMVKNGISISDTYSYGSSSSSPMFIGAGVYLYWLAEIGIALWIAIVVARKEEDKTAYSIAPTARSSTNTSIPKIE